MTCWCWGFKSTSKWDVGGTWKQVHGEGYKGQGSGRVWNYPIGGGQGFPPLCCQSGNCQHELDEWNFTATKTSASWHPSCAWMPCSTMWVVLFHHAVHSFQFVQLFALQWQPWSWRPERLVSATHEFYGLHPQDESYSWRCKARKHHVWPVTPTLLPHWLWFSISASCTRRTQAWFSAGT